jgi:xanthine/uracil permease
MGFGDRFAGRNATGMLIRGGVAFVLITPMVAAAKAWWSALAAGVIGVVAVAVYISVATRYMSRRRPPMA